MGNATLPHMDNSKIASCGSFAGATSSLHMLVLVINSCCCSDSESLMCCTSEYQHPAAAALVENQKRDCMMIFQS